MMIYRLLKTQSFYDSAIKSLTIELFSIA